MANGTNSNTPSENLETPSFTAFCVALSYLRSLKTREGLELHQEEAQLIESILTTVLENEKFSMMWALKYTLFYLPYWLQSLIIHRFTETGYDSLILGRKLLIRELIDRSVREGIEQVVFLGAGYDTAGIIKAVQHSDVNFFEFDKNAHNLQNKSSAKISVDIFYRVSNWHFLKCDVASDELVSELTSNSLFDKNKKTLFIGEGLTMYLSEQENINLLNNLKNIVTNNENIKVILSFVRSKEQGFFSSTFLRTSNESYKFAKTPEQVPEFVNNNGYTLIAKSTQLSMFSAVGDKRSIEIYNRNTTNKRFHPDEEYYYSLKPSSDNTVQNIGEVEEISFSAVALAS